MALGNKCVKCGIDDPRVLDVDHIDPSKKTRPKHRNYPTAIRVALWERETDNLQLLCANCHRVKTHEQSWSRLPLAEPRMKQASLLEEGR